MSTETTLYFLIAAVVLVLVLLVMIVRRIRQEGISVTATSRQQHFKRSVEEVYQQHEQERSMVDADPDAAVIIYGKYGFGKKVDMPFDTAIEAVTNALQGEGFGVLSDIDVAATLKKKLDKDMPPYRILGACNPQLASRAIDTEPSIGLLLPCNVLVRQDLSDAVHVEVMDPGAALGLVGNPDIGELASEVRARLERVLQNLK